ncbi:MAG: F0F1 ATP synthase subunit A [Chlorobiales bacterium]|nr:F0F1 ATP synthase subunit A [Chlorobiales bacterium]
MSLLRNRNSQPKIAFYRFLGVLLVSLISFLPASYANEAAESAAHTGAAAHSDEKLDVVHHILDSHSFDFEPFGTLQLPHGWVVGGIDISPTRHVVMVWVSALVMLLIFSSVGSYYKKNDSKKSPKGLANLMEVLVDFVRAEVAPNIGPGYERFMPFLLTIFFFILTCNLLGLIPYSATATSNINVTVTLAVFTFFVTQATAIRAHGIGGYIAHLTGGTHPLLWPIMVPVEFIGLFTKPFALTVRLFANMTAGHIVIMSLIGLIFIFKTYFIAPVAIGFSLFIYLIEVLVAFLQAFIFTLLSSLFIGMAGAHEEHKEHGEAAHTH